MTITTKNKFLILLALGILLIIILVPLYTNDMLNVGEFRLLTDVTIPTSKCFPVNKSGSFIALSEQSYNDRINSLKDSYGISNINVIKNPGKNVFSNINITWKDNDSKLYEVIKIINDLYGTLDTYIISKNIRTKSGDHIINTSDIQLVNKSDIKMVPMEIAMQKRALASTDETSSNELNLDATNGIVKINTKIYGSGSRIVQC